MDDGWEAAAKVAASHFAASGNGAPAAPASVTATGGAGYDTVNVKACTEAGVLVVNQTGGNAQSVAQHVLAMVISLSKQIVQTNHALRAGRLSDDDWARLTNAIGKLDRKSVV